LDNVGRRNDEWTFTLAGLNISQLSEIEVSALERTTGVRVVGRGPGYAAEHFIQLKPEPF
jgi:hypothetical protein